MSFSKEKFIGANFIFWQRFWHLFVSHFKLIQNIFSSQIFTQFKLYLPPLALFLYWFRALQIHIILFVTNDSFHLFINFVHFFLLLLLSALIMIQFGDKRLIDGFPAQISIDVVWSEFLFHFRNHDCFSSTRPSNRSLLMPHHSVFKHLSVAIGIWALFSKSLSGDRVSLLGKSFLSLFFSQGAKICVQTRL